ncbi:MAG: threonine/serine dehydratase [Rhizobiaceae bacterium]
MPETPAFADIKTAAQRIAGMVVRTPLLRSDALDEITGARVFVKAECLQRTGSFKMRGAANAISALSPDQRRHGVVASSSGNHAQGVAQAARDFGIPATIVMPLDAPALKIERTRRLGAEVVLYDRDNEDRDAIAAEHVSQKGAAFIHPFDNPYVIAGQGTCGLEIADDLQAMGIVPDHVICCTGGGGLTAGVGLAVRDRFASASMHTCEPEGFDDYRRSLEAGERLRNARTSGTACDAIVTPMPGEISFAVASKLGMSGFAVSDAEAFGAMRFAFRELKCVVEPGGAVALAAVLRASDEWHGRTLVCTLSGGNVDDTLFARVLAQQS